jgi:hypothetical protein
MADAQDIVNSVIAKQQSSPVVPKATATAPVKYNLKPIQAPAPVKAPGEDKGDKGLLGGLISSVGNVIKFPATVIQNVPTIIGKGVQTVGGVGEALFSIGTNIFNEDLYHSRTEVDYEKGKALGLKGTELIAYSLQRSMPLIAPMITSIPATGARLAETATLGAYDTGAPGFDYYQALRQGELGNMLIEDVGNVVLAGRLSGLGNVGVKAGTAISKAGAPRLGSAVSGAGMFAEQPIGTIARGAGRGLSTAPIAARFPKLAEAGGRVATSETPLRGIYGEAVDARRAFANTKWMELQQKIVDLQKEYRATGIDNSEQIKLLEEQRDAVLNKTGLPKMARGKIDQLSRAGEGLRTQIVATFIRFKDRGAIPEAVDDLLAQESRVRKAAQTAEKAGETERAQNLYAQADIIKQKADIKASDTEGVLSQPAPDWVAPATTLYTTGQVNGIIADLRAGKSMQEILQAITPEQVGPELADMGYGYTELAVLKAIDYAEGRLTPVERIQMDVYQQIQRNWNQFWWDQSQARTGYTTETVPYTYAGTTPDPRNILLELSSGKYTGRFIANLNSSLDKIAVQYLEQVAPGLAAELKIDLADPKPGIWVTLARNDVGSPAYDAAYKLIQIGFDELRANPGFARFMQNEMIYPAAMRVSMLNEQRRLKLALNDDIGFVAERLRSLLSTHSDIIPKNFLDAITKALQKASDPQGQFDLSTFKRLERNLASLIKLTTERLTKLQEEQGVLAARQAGVDTKLIDAINQMAEMQRIVLAITENPQAILGDTPKLASAIEAEQANLSRIEAIPDEIAQVDAEIKAEVDRQRTANAYLQQELDNTQVSLDEARTRATETADAEATVRQQLDQEQAYLDAHGKLTAEEIAALQTDFETALRIHGQYASGDKFVSKDQAQSVKNRLVREAKDRVYTAQGVMELLLPGTMRRAYTMAIGLSIDPNAMSFMDEGFRSSFEAGVAQVLVDYELAKKATKDFIETRTVMDEGQSVDGARMEAEDTSGGSDIRGREFNSDDDYMIELGRAWAEQWQAEKDLGRAKQRGVEAIRKELAETNQANIDQAIEASTVTQQNLPWIERMIELEDRAVLAERTSEVQRLRSQLDAAKTAAEKAQANLNKLAAQVAKLTDQVRPKVPNELLTRRSKLEKEVTTTQKAVARLAKAVETATRQQEKSLQTRTRGRLQGIGKIEPATVTFETLDNQGNPVRIAGTNPNAGVPVLNKTVADKLTDQEQQALNETVNINLKVAKVREQVAANEPLQTEATNVLAQSDINQQAQLLRPVGPQLLTEPPIYFPGGTTSAAAERVAIPMTMRSEGLAPQVKAQYENTKQTGLTATSVGQQAGKLNEVMGQFSRNVVVEEFITSPEFALPTSNVVGIQRVLELQQAAINELQNQGIPRNTPQFETALKRRTGELLIRELRLRGYEPVSPVKFDPEVPSHSPVGGLQEIVGAETVDANTIAMRIGLRDTIASRFEPVHGNTTPSAVTRVFDKVGKLTQGWKSVVLPFSLRWQVGDLVGNIMNAWIRGDIPANEMVRAMQDVKNRITVDGDGIVRTLKSDVADQTMADPVLAALVGAGLEARGLRGAELKAISEGTLRPVGERISSRMFPKFRQKAFNVNATQNLIARAAVAITKLEAELASKGRTLDEIDPITLLNDKVLNDAVVKAVQETNSTLGAFAEMTPWERNVLRQVFPFWSWIKFINKAAAQLVLDQPDRVLFYGHIGSMYTSGDGKDLMDWLKDKTPTPFGFMDFRFLNPYSDALIFSRNPFEAVSQTFTRPSPVIMTGIDAANALGFYATGKNLIPYGGMSRPGYLEGRLGASARGVGDLAGELGYMALNRFGGPFRNVLTVLPNEIPIIAPEGRLIGTDVAIGTRNLYPQGSARTQGIYAEPRLNPTLARVGAILASLGIPAPMFDTEKAYAQGETQAAKDEKARLRRVVARLQSVQ